MKRLFLLTAFCVYALSFSDSYVNAQPPGGRPGSGGGRQSGPGGEGPGGRGQKMSNPAAQQTPPLLRIFDADGDGELSSEEIDAAANALRKLDQNRDGKLTAEELRPAGAGGRVPGGTAPGMRQSRERQGPGGPPGGGSPGGGRSGVGAASGRRGGDLAQTDAAFAEEIMAFDENMDGALGKSELPEHMHKAFASADANQDGALDEGERLVLASQFHRNSLNRTGDAPVNVPTQGRRPQH
ncbi:EF-hand domain-containing protein [Aureliella helgolandensis]|uniref:EF hand n=1 Tax=Aureliella helgolandensis TaxID=2527968 RepID=A0A518G3Q6_9BACT|nr:hypothetical protein [Aureliella helgolandensis]QDV23222.1 EF hand [Aureliella helgolandensis]